MQGQKWSNEPVGQHTHEQQQLSGLFMPLLLKKSMFLYDDTTLCSV